MTHMPNEHDVSIYFNTYDAEIETYPDNFVPVFLGQDRRGSMIYFVDRPASPLDAYKTPEVLAVCNGGSEIYYVIKRKEGCNAIPEDVVRFLEKQSLDEYYKKCLDDMSLFVGINENEMQQAKISEKSAWIPSINGIRMDFRLDAIEGTLILPKSHDALSYPFVKIRGSPKIRPIEKIAISQVS